MELIAHHIIAYLVNSLVIAKDKIIYETKTNNNYD